MNLTLSEKYLNDFITDEQRFDMRTEVVHAYDLIKNRSGAGSSFLGWVDLPVAYDREEFARIQNAATYIRQNCDIFIVIGIGGSYLGARAAIEFCQGQLHNRTRKEGPEICFAGNSISTACLNELLALCEGKRVCVNVISKSGTTTEPAIAFRFFRMLLEKRYGSEEARKRIFVTTDRVRGNLKTFADAQGYECFVIPDDIGGRYSVLTAVGLLPIAVAGIDISAMMDGAARARDAYMSDATPDNDCARYAVLRNILYRNGKKIELLASYEPAFSMMGEWWKQLYGESEGKDGKGIFPASAIFSTDLHSLGQLIQQGERNLFETVVSFETEDDTAIIPFDEGNSDEMNYVAKKTLSEVQKNAYLATVLSHTDGDVPNILLTLGKRDAFHFGYLVYFFEAACALSGYILGVNPFNQPGVEGYKDNMYALLGKPGEKNRIRRDELLKRIR